MSEQINIKECMEQLDYCFIHNRPKLYGEICDKVRRAGYMIYRNKWGKHLISPEEEQ